MSDRRASAFDGTGAAPTFRQATLALQIVLVYLVGFNLYLGDLGYAVNAALMLGIAVIPDAVYSRYGHRVHPALGLLIAASALLHTVGAMGPYATVPLYDQVAHAVSSAIVAGFGYVLVMVVDRHVEGVDIPPKLRFVFILIFAISFGVVWEIVEFATDYVTALLIGDTVLTQYGLRDTILDMLFNTIGAVLVALWGTTIFDRVRGPVARQLEDSQ